MKYYKTSNGYFGSSQPVTVDYISFFSGKRKVKNMPALNLYPEEVFTLMNGRDMKYADEIDEACNDIYEACKGFGTDEEKLNEVLGNKTAAERYMIAARFKQMFGKELKSLIKSETSGDYGKLIQLLCVPLDQAEAQLIREATKGAGTTEKALYPVRLLSFFSVIERVIISYRFAVDDPIKKSHC